MEEKYVRPKITYTDTLQNKKEMKKQLEGFYDIEYEDINRGDILKYVCYNKKQKKYLFRIGGIVHKKAFGKIQLKNNKNTYYWYVNPVQKVDDEEFPTYFYKKYTREDELEERIDELEEENRYLRSIVDKIMK
tara:strand:- start:63 stop:461 length:399 start_codon:yes stop_codon:yes gene_type:complete